MGRGRRSLTQYVALLSLPPISSPNPNPPSKQGNEPSFATPFLYNYLPGRQWKSVLRSRQTVDTYYSNTRSGLPGNSDAGALDAWLVWQMLGLYPVATQPVYLILAPMFQGYTMRVGDRQGAPRDRQGAGGGDQKVWLNVTATGLDESAGSIYVQSLSVNGQAWNRSWLAHEDIAGGGTLEFVLGPTPVSWDVGGVPPSPGHR